VVLDGQVGFLRHCPLHDAYRGLTPWLGQPNKYVWLHRPGFLGGRPDLVFCLLMRDDVMTGAKLYELNREGSEWTI
jgi:hypothetical protein